MEYFEIYWNDEQSNVFTVDDVNHAMNTIWNDNGDIPIDVVCANDDECFAFRSTHHMGDVY